ncbi:MAG TPA: CHAT domain-containing protein [Herpetosiphonaceae bacterium]|nr:CHAT domain-containing protein [Herpetosiphonaceae bacterium]
MPLLSPQHSARLRIIACRTLAKTIDRGKDPLRWAEAQVELGFWLLQIYDNPAEDIDEAIACYERALECYHPQTTTLQWIHASIDLAGAYLARLKGEKSANIEKAIGLLSQSMPVVGLVPGSQEGYNALVLLALAYLERPLGKRAENLEEALRILAEALRNVAPHDQQRRWGIYTNLAGIYSMRLRGEPEENLEHAITYAQLALDACAQAGELRNAIGNRINLANFYAGRLRGQPGENRELAEQHAEAALAAARQARDPILLYHALSNLAEIRLTYAPDLGAAVGLYRQALGIFSPGESPGQHAASQHQLAVALSEQARAGDSAALREASGLFESALKVYTRETHPERWGIIQRCLAGLRALAIAQPGDQHDQQAVAGFERALAVFSPELFPGQCRDASFELGKTHYRLGRIAEARSTLSRGLAAIENLRAQTLRQEARERVIARNMEYYRMLVECCLVGRDPSAAFEVASASKARAMADILATGRLDLPTLAAANQRLAQRWRRLDELGRELDQARDTLAGRAAPSGMPPWSEPADLERRIRDLQQDIHRGWSDLAYEFPQVGLLEHARALDAAGAQALAAALNATLVEYYYSAGGWTAFVITQDSTSAFDLPAAHAAFAKGVEWLDRTVHSGRQPSAGAQAEPGVPTARYGRPIDPAAEEFDRGVLARLHAGFIAPFRADLDPARTLVLSPSGRLIDLPLAACFDEGSNRFLVDDFVITVTPGLGVLDTVRRNARPPAGPPSSLLSVAYPGHPGSYDYLPGVIAESDAIAQRFAAPTQIHHDAATPAAVLAAPPADVVHFGCHGDFDTAAPDESGLLLAGGWLSARRILNGLDLRQARLVTVGACLSGRNTVRIGDEAAGLLRAFFVAGAPCVVAALWEIDDAATAQFFKAFYARITQGEPPETALRQAQLQLRSTQRWSSPRFWAAFQVYGVAGAAQSAAS